MGFKTIIEPFRIKVVEPIKITDRAQREKVLEEAHYNLFLIKSDDVMIDLLTDSGTSALSADQWSAMMKGDESYAGSRSWVRFEQSVKEIFGFKNVIPVHQGRAAERILFASVVKPGNVVPNNAHFDTTRANIEYLGGVAIDLPCAESRDAQARHPFKGNMDAEALERLIQKEGPDNVPLVMLTITNNSGGGQPVSMANIKDVRTICDRYGLPLYLDACRFAENAYFIKLGERGYADQSPLEIAREMFSLADGCTMSAKKDGISNIGGFLCSNDDRLAQQEKELLILTEGFPTYGGLAGRDLESMSVGLYEALDEQYLQYRFASTRYLGEHISSQGVPIIQPPGGHAIYIDAGAMLPQIPAHCYPGQSLAVELYREGGIRSCEIGTVMFGKPDPATGRETPANRELVRLAIPRRVYTQSHVDYTVEAILAVYERRSELKGYRIAQQPEFLRHFSAWFEPIP
ncbi:MAG: tryptophanase [Armatimonadetes bacterium]|nr:tryptophanase [Armatimonadota bacterium]